MTYYGNKLLPKPLTEQFHCEGKTVPPDYCAEQTYMLEKKQNNRFISLKYRMYLSAAGKGKIIFDVSQFDMYTVVICNSDLSPIKAFLEISPDKHFFKRDSDLVKEIAAGEMDTFIAKVFLKYAAVILTGSLHASTIIYLQGQMT